MPSKVLHGPRDEGKIALLNLLLRSHAAIETPDLASNNPVASASFISACRTNNITVLKALVRREYWAHTDDIPDIGEAHAEDV